MISTGEAWNPTDLKQDISSKRSSEYRQKLAIDKAIKLLVSNGVISQSDIVLT